MKNIEIADEMGCTEQIVSMVRNSKLGRQHLEMILRRMEAARINVHAEMDALLPLAIEVYEDILLESSDERLQKQVADAILDRTGHGAVKNVNIRHTKGPSDEDISKIKEISALYRDIEEASFEDILEEEE